MHTEKGLKTHSTSSEGTNAGSFDKTPARPNIVARSVARVGLSIRWKLLVAFLGVTALMVGLALFGLSALEQANDRTKKLLQDQERIALYYEVESALETASMMTIAVVHHPGEETNDITTGWTASPLIFTINRLDGLQFLTGNGLRTFGKTSAEDRVRLNGLRVDFANAKKIAQRVRALRKAGELTLAGQVALGELFPLFQESKRDAFTIVQEIEAEMAKTATSNALAYQASRQQVIATALVSVGLALLMGYSISSSLIWPVRRIGQALGLVARGEFETRVAVPNRDELGDLAGNVNAMGARLAELYDQIEGQRVELAAWNTALEEKVSAQVDLIERTNRLRRFLPGPVADMIVEAGDDADMLGSRRSEVTVLFADLRGFTAYANAATPETVIKALNAFHEAVGPMIDARGGTLERFLGDGVMVLFNAPVPMEKPEENAILLAQDMITGFTTYMAAFQSGPRKLGLGIGIATGEAIMGRIGFEGQLDYAAIGTAPNLAARLCDKAVDGQILLDEITSHRVPVETRTAGPFHLKGIGNDIPVFELQ